MEIEVEKDSGGKETIRAFSNSDLDGITILPQDVTEIDSERYTVYSDGAVTLRKLIEQAGVVYTPLPDEESGSTLIHQSIELTLPTLYLSHIFVRDNWDQIRFVFDTISNHYNSTTRGDVEMVIEQETSTGNTTRITYRGPASGIESVTETIQEVTETGGDNE